MSVFELAGGKGLYKSLALISRAPEAVGEPCLFAKECSTLPVLAYKIFSKHDEFRFLPWQENLPLRKGRRCVAAVSRPWLSQRRSYRAEVRFARSCAAFLAEADLAVEEGEGQYALLWGARPVATVEVRAQGRYRVQLELPCPFPTELLLLVVALVDKVVHDPPSALSASSLVGKAVGSTSFVARAVLKQAGAQGM